MVPNAGLPAVTFGAPSGGVFVRLKISVRKSRLMLSRIRVRFTRATSALRYAGPRTGLREQLRSSPLMDAERFTRNLESAYRGMWMHYCENVSGVGR